MSKKSYSGVTTDAEQILTSTTANPDLQPIVAKHRPQIEGVLSEIKSLKAQQMMLTADKQRVTQDLQTALKWLKELVIFLRAAIRGDIGPRTEKLVEYRITPLRNAGARRSRPVRESPRSQARPPSRRSSPESCEALK